MRCATRPAGEYQQQIPSPPPDGARRPPVTGGARRFGSVPQPRYGTAGYQSPFGRTCVTSGERDRPPPTRNAELGFCNTLLARDHSDNTQDGRTAGWGDGSRVLRSREPSPLGPLRGGRMRLVLSHKRTFLRRPGEAAAGSRAGVHGVSARPWGFPPHANVGDAVPFTASQKGPFLRQPWELPGVQLRRTSTLGLLPDRRIVANSSITQSAVARGTLRCL